jgi:hypothetical protein
VVTWLLLESQVVGTLWPEAFFALCRLVQSGGGDMDAVDSSTQPLYVRVVTSGVNMLRMIMGIRQRIAFLVHKDHRAGLLEVQESGVRSALALLPLRGETPLPVLLRRLNVGDSDRNAVQPFTLPASVFRTRGGGPPGGGHDANNRYAHTGESRCVGMRSRCLTTLTPPSNTFL